MGKKGDVSRRTFVDAGKPMCVMGAAVKSMRPEGNALVLDPDETWGNPLFADCALEGEDFHIHARLTLDSLTGTGASLLIGGFYHYPCSRPEGNQTFRVSLDDDMQGYDPYTLETDGYIAYGMTARRAPWSSAHRKVAGQAKDFIEPGKPFSIDVFQNGPDLTFQIDGKDVFHTSLRQKDRIVGASDGGWPACFGFLPDRAAIKLHDFYAEGPFTEAQLDHNDVWTMGDNGYFTYRIPSLCVASDGSVLAFAEARRSDFTRAWSWSKEWNADDVHCVMKRSTDGGRTWSSQKVILACGSVYEARDPSPVVDKETGNVFLLTRGPYVMQSENGGESWSKPRSLRELLPPGTGMLTPGPANSALQLQREEHAGRLMVAVAGEGSVGVIVSDDHGETWSLGGMTTGHDGYEPELVELGDGRVLINSRNHSDNPGRLISISHDGGASFEEHYDADLPSTRCEASLICCPMPEESEQNTTAAFLYCSPAEGRRNLTVKMSRDNCETWPVSREIYSGHSAYSAMTVLPDGDIGILYEKDGYRRLSFVRLNPHTAFSHPK